MMEGAPVFGIALLAAIMAVLAGIIGAIWPHTATRWVVGLVYAVPITLAAPYLLTAQSVVVGMSGHEPSGDFARKLLLLAFGSFAVGFLSARFGSGIRQDFAAVKSPSTMNTDEKVK